MSRALRTLPLVALMLVAADAPKAPPKKRLSDEEKAIVEMTNKARAKEGLEPLTVNPLLCRVARAHSANQAEQGKMAHELDGKKPADRVKEAGYKYRAVGENVAMGGNGVSLDEIFEGWMKSKGHRENILRPVFHEIGVGVARNTKGDTYYTQVFGTPMDE
jgi:uncharacterized protein YkwD